MGSLILVRHAITAASAAGRNLGQRSDLPLSDSGLDLARALGRNPRPSWPSSRTTSFMLSSPALRCRQTAAAVAAALELEESRIQVEAGLIEIDYGAWDGLSPEECGQRDPELRAAWEADPFVTRCPDGESGQDVAERAFAALGAVEEWLAADRARCAIVVAHNHVNRLRLCHLLGWPMREYRDRLVQDPGAYNLITLGGGTPVLRRLNAPAT